MKKIKVMKVNRTNYPPYLAFVHDWSDHEWCGRGKTKEEALNHLRAKMEDEGVRLSQRAREWDEWCGKLKWKNHKGLYSGQHTSQ